jgi:hypothetical protein
MEASWESPPRGAAVTTSISNIIWGALSHNRTIRGTPQRTGLTRIQPARPPRPTSTWPTSLMVRARLSHALTSKTPSLIGAVGVWRCPGSLGITVGRRSNKHRGARDSAACPSSRWKRTTGRRPICITKEEGASSRPGRITGAISSHNLGTRNLASIPHPSPRGPIPARS